MSITTRDLARLASILRRLDSDFPGERAAAGLLASRWMHERGLAWEDLIQAPSPASSPPPAAPAPGAKVRAAPADSVAAQAFVHIAGVAGVVVLTAAAAAATSARDLLLPIGALAAYVSLWRGVAKFLPRWQQRRL